MSISAYVGLPGHGKSYGAVENVIIPSLKKGRVVFTNIPVNSDLCIKDFGSAPIPFQTSDIEKNPNWFTDVFIAGSIFVFDEVWRLWPAGLKANNVLEQHKNFLAEHRHLVGENGMSTEIYLVTQDLSQVSNFARKLVETTYRMVKRISLGFDSRFRVDIYEGDVTGSKPPVSKRIRELHGGKFDKKIYQYYKSHTKSENGLAGNEERTDKRNNALGRLSIKLGLLFFFIAIPLIYWGFGKLTGFYGADDVQKPVETKPSSPSSIAVKTKKVSPSFLSKAKELYVSHTVKTNNHSETFFSISFSDMRSVVSIRDLQKLGYKVLPFNSCLVFIEGFDYSDYVMCKSPAKSTGFVQSAVAGISQDDVL